MWKSEPKNLKRRKGGRNPPGKRDVITENKCFEVALARILLVMYVDVVRYVKLIQHGGIIEFIYMA